MKYKIHEGFCILEQTCFGVEGAMSSDVTTAWNLCRFLISDFWSHNSSEFLNCSLVVWRPVFTKKCLDTVFTTIEEEDVGLDFGQGVAGIVAESRIAFSGVVKHANPYHHVITTKYGWNHCEIDIVENDGTLLGLYGLYSGVELNIDSDAKSRLINQLSAALMLIDIVVNAELRDNSLEKSLLALEVGKAAEDRFHDIKETLFGASGALGGLSNNNISPTNFNRNIDILKKQIERAKDFADQYIKEAKNPNQLNRSDFDVCRVTHHIVKDLELRSKQRASQRGRKIDVHFEVPDLPIIINGDLERIARAIGNVIYNAEHWVIRAPDPRSATRITVTLSTDEFFFYLKVFDTGPGIIEPKRALEKGYSLKGGTGLGLCIAKRVFELHSGSIEIKSEPGKWTSVRLNLPLP